MAESDEKKFTVTDRRNFDASGERKTNSVPEAPAAPASSATPEVAAKAHGPVRQLPPADFATLVLSLGSSALMYLGQGDEPPGKKAPVNLPMAKHAIDLLTVLEEKTKGNLTSEEQQVLESLLFDLRLRYVEALKTGSASPASP